MVFNIIEIGRVPVYYDNNKDFSTVTYLKPSSDKLRGLHLPDCDSIEAFEHYRINTPNGFNRIKELISAECAFDDISFSIFSILHELGHWLQYICFISKGNDDIQFIENYESKRIYLLQQRKNEYETCKSPEDIAKIEEKYEKLYAELPTEKYANTFAIKHLLECVTKIKFDNSSDVC